MKKAQFFVVFRCTRSNVFISLYRKKNEKKYYPVLCKSINRYTVSGKSKTTKNEIKDFVKLAALYIRKTVNKKKNFLILVFKNLGVRVLRRNQTHKGIYKFRRFVILALSAAGVKINAVLDASTVPFNGCKLAKHRRRKRKRLIKDTTK